MAVQINRDPFARASLMRDTLGKEDRDSCKWCGREHSKFMYGWEGDQYGNNRTYLNGPFCSISCYRTFTGQ